MEGNVNPTDPSIQRFPKPIHGQFVRIYPMQYQTNPCMKVEIYAIGEKIYYSHKMLVKFKGIVMGNHMIWSVIWDNSAQVIFLKANQIVRPRKADSFQIVQEKSCDYLLIIYECE